MQSTWSVYLNKQGHPMTVQVQAGNQNEARRFAEHQYPGYKAGAAKRV
jgi:hypothetical protein